MDEADKIERIRIIQDRIRCPELFRRIMSAEAAAGLIRDSALRTIKAVIVEAIGIDSDGSIIPAAGSGGAAALVADADQVVVELNVVKSGDWSGMPHILCGPEKIAAVVITDKRDKAKKMKNGCN